MSKTPKESIPVRRTAEIDSDEKKFFSYHTRSRWYLLGIFRRGNNWIASDRLERTRGKAHTPGETEAIYRRVAGDLDRFAAKHGTVKFLLEESVEHMIHFFTHGPGWDIFPWTLRHEFKRKDGTRRLRWKAIFRGNKFK